MSTSDDVRDRAATILRAAGIILTPHERDAIEVTDFGLGHPEQVGLQLLTYVNTDRYCARDLGLFANQTCPEHYHPPLDGTTGKEKTLRVRQGRVYLYVPGDPTPNPFARPYRAEHYTAWHEIVLDAGDQHTIPPSTRHWFHAPYGAIVSEFATQSRDQHDVFTDPKVVRVSPTRHLSSGVTR